MSEALASYRFMEAKLLGHRLRNAGPESNDESVLLDQMDVAWEKLTESEREGLDTLEVLVIGEAETIDAAETFNVEQVEVKADKPEPFRIRTGIRKPVEEIMADCEARYRRVCERAWAKNAIAVIAYSHWPEGSFFDFDVAPGLPVRTTKNLAVPNAHNFVQYVGGCLTAKQAHDLFSAALAARANAPHDTIVYAFSFPKDYVVPEGLVREIIDDNPAKQAI